VTVTVAEARARTRRTVDRSIRRWAADPEPEASLVIALAPPSERAVLADYAAAVAWSATWREVDGVEWATRRWASVGTQQVPVRLVLDSVDRILAFAGAGTRWRALRERLERVGRAVTARTKVDDVNLRSVLANHATVIEALGEIDTDRLIAVLAWLDENLTTGRRIRELPIAGVDTKWIDRHRGLVEKLHAVRHGGGPLDFLPNPRMITVRFLDRSFAPAGLQHLAVPVDDLAALPIRPGNVLMCENLETVIALPELDDTVAVHGAGYGLSSWAGAIPWLHTARLVYWGDLDSHGFSILNELRSVLNPTSVLMDESTLASLRVLWVTEPKPTRGVLSRLTPDEAATLDRLRAEDDCRLEQERIPWPMVVSALNAAGFRGERLSSR